MIVPLKKISAFGFILQSAQHMTLKFSVSIRKQQELTSRHESRVTHQVRIYLKHGSCSVSRALLSPFLFRPVLNLVLLLLDQLPLQDMNSQLFKPQLKNNVFMPFPGARMRSERNRNEHGTQNSFSALITVTLPTLPKNFYGIHVK